MMMYKTTLTALGFSTLMAGSVFAGVSAEEAARLGKDLTPLGAEMAGNADGSIPAWNSAGPAIPADYVPGSDNYTSPYADEKPLFSIDINNYKEYADNMGAASIAMMEKLGPDGWRMDIYPTHRDFVPVDWLARNAKKNATDLKVLKKGELVIDAKTKAKWVIISHRQIAVRIKAKVYFLLKDRRGYTITCSAAPEKFDRYVKLFDAIAKSFRFE